MTSISQPIWAPRTNPHVQTTLILTGLCIGVIGLTKKFGHLRPSGQPGANVKYVSFKSPKKPHLHLQSKYEEKACVFSVITAGHNFNYHNPSVTYLLKVAKVDQLAQRDRIAIIKPNEARALSVSIGSSSSA
jgi:hypothetical protein